MKKLIFALISIICLIATILSALAVPTPYPVYGKIMSNDAPVANAEVRVQVGSIDASVYTNNEGFYMVDLGNYEGYYYDGNVITVSLKYCSEFPICKQTGKISDGAAEINWDLAKVQQEIEKPLPENVEILTYVCWDGSKVSDVSKCKIQEVITKIVCFDGSEVTKVEDCPVEPEPIITPNQAIVAAIAIVIIGLGIMWTWAKNNGLSGKYRWIPGMKGILEKNLERYKELCKLGKKKEAEAMKNTLLKYSSTLTDKYLSQFQK